MRFSAAILVAVLVGLGSGLNVISDEPRDKSTTIAGVPWLARMADKAQLSSEERLHGGLQFPCPNDQKLCRSMGVEPEDFKHMVIASPDDETLEGRLKIKIGEPALRALSHPRFKKHPEPSQFLGC